MRKPLTRTELRRKSWWRPVRTTPMRKRNPKQAAKKSQRYAAVLRSAHCRNLRAQCVTEQGNRCATCGCEFTQERGERATLSHLTYARFGHELREDVQADCERCNTAERKKRRWYESNGNPFATPTKSTSPNPGATDEL